MIVITNKYRGQHPRTKAQIGLGRRSRCVRTCSTGRGGMVVVMVVIVIEIVAAMSCGRIIGGGVARRT